MDLGVQTIYKWVDDKNCTDSHGHDDKYCKFGRDKMVSKPVKPDGDYYLCGPDVLHAFATVTQAFMNRGSLVSDRYTKLWKGVGNVVAYDSTKVGCQWIKLQTLVDIPSYVQNQSDYYVNDRHYIGVVSHVLDISNPRKLTDMCYFYRDVQANLDIYLRKAKAGKANLSRVMVNPQYLLEDLLRLEANYPKVFGFVTAKVLQYDAKHKVPFVKNKTE